MALTIIRGLGILKSGGLMNDSMIPASPNTSFHIDAQNAANAPFA